MGRPIRIYYPGLIYHVLNRGNNCQIVFAEDADYRHYLDMIRRYKEKFNFKIFAYCLMINHVHLLLQVSEKGSISKIMQAITIAHTRYYHYKYQTLGHVWQGRFKSPIVSNDEYLLTAIRYIEQNPVRASLVSHPKDYPFSSYHNNIKIENNGLTDKEDNPVFLSLGNTTEERIKRYREFASTILEDEKLRLIRKSLGGQSHFTSKEFQNQIDNILKKSRKRTIGRPRRSTADNLCATI